jgi:hypothetical protein
MGVQGGSIFAVHDFVKAHDSVRKEILYHIIIEFGIPNKLVRLINMR